MTDASPIHWLNRAQAEARWPSNDDRQTALEILTDKRGRSGHFRSSDGWDITLGETFAFPNKDD